MLWTTSDGRRWQESARAVEGLAAGDLVERVDVAAGRMLANGIIRAASLGDEERAAWSSQDAVRWERRRPEDRRSIANGHGRAVAVSGDGAWYSDDGIEWHRSRRGPIHARIDAVVHGPVGFVAIGSDVTRDARRAWRSATGTNWAEIALPAGFGAHAIAASPSGYVAVGRLSTWYSRDALIWAETPSPWSGGSLEEVIWSGTGFVVEHGNEDWGFAMGYATSPDGMHWRYSDFPTEPSVDWGTMRAIAGAVVVPATIVSRVGNSQQMWYLAPLGLPETETAPVALPSTDPSPDDSLVVYLLIAAGVAAAHATSRRPRRR